MALVRESSRAKVSPEKNLANWPPKSPYEALLSSPSGRRRWEDRQSGRKRTPSPSSRKAPPRPGKTPEDVLKQLGDPFESDQEEDEETLQLKLQAIEAKLKLKKLRQAKDRPAKPETKTLGLLSPQADSRQSSPARKRQRINHDVQVPVSPVRPSNIPAVGRSPAKVLLGIDKGWKAEDVSLKRPRPNIASVSRANAQKTPPRVKSFTERLAESRDSQLQKDEKAARISNARGKSFGLASATNVSITRESTATPSLVSGDARPSLLEMARKKSSSSISTSSVGNRTSTAGRALLKHKKGRAMSTEDALTYEPFSQLHLSKRTLSAETLTSLLQDRELYPIPRLLKEIKSPAYEPPDCEADYVVFGIIASKSAPLDIRSGPAVRSSSPDSNSTEKKFMVLKLTDLKWEIDLFLFSTAFSRYWKLPVGTLVAILNPSIMPPRPHARDTGRFSLKLSSVDDEVIELGVARDLGFCASIKKDGQPCDSWIDSSKDKHCDFHINLAIDRQRSQRMDVNSMHRFMSSLLHPRSGSGERETYRNIRCHRGPTEDGSEGKGKYRKARGRDFETGETFLMGPARSAKEMLDREDLAGPEEMRKRLAQKEKERALSKRLSEIGNGAGAEYLRAAATTAAETDEGRTGSSSRRRGRSPTKKRVDSGLDHNADPDPDWELDITGKGGERKKKPDAAALGLVSKADGVRLSPVRGRRRAPHEMAEAVGWSGAFKRGAFERGDAAAAASVAVPVSSSSSSLLLTRTRASSPKKKARYLLAEKGIREPGRESLGDAIGEKAGGDSDDDDLDIIR